MITHFVQPNLTRGDEWYRKRNVVLSDMDFRTSSAQAVVNLIDRQVSIHKLRPPKNQAQQSRLVF